MPPDEQASEIVSYIFSYLAPFSRVFNQLSAGKIAIDNQPGELYLTSSQGWRWVADIRNTRHAITLSNEDVARLVEPYKAFHNLVGAALDLIGAFRQHLELLEMSPVDTNTLILHYLQDPDAIAIDLMLKEPRTFNRADWWAKIKESGRSTVDPGPTIH